MGYNFPGLLFTGVYDNSSLQKPCLSTQSLDSIRFLLLKSHTLLIWAIRTFHFEILCWKSCVNFFTSKKIDFRKTLQILSIENNLLHKKNTKLVFWWSWAEISRFQFWTSWFWAKYSSLELPKSDGPTQKIWYFRPRSSKIKFRIFFLCSKLLFIKPICRVFRKSIFFDMKKFTQLFQAKCTFPQIRY